MDCVSIVKMAIPRRSTVRGRWIAARRKVRELSMVARALASTSHPVLAQIIPMRFCNLSCAYCNEYDKVSEPVPLEEMYRRIDHLGRLGTAMIGISGGEPLTHPRLDDIIRRIRRTGAIAGMITNGYLLNGERIERLNRAGLDHMQISIDNLEPDDVSKKSLKVLDKKLQMLAQYAEFHVNINSVVGGGFKDPNDALVIGKRALELGFESTIGIIHDGRRATEAAEAGRSEGLLRDDAPEEDQLLALRPLSGGDCAGPAERLALPRRVALPLYLRGRAGALLLAAARLSGRAAGRVHNGGCKAGVFDREELLAQLHHRLRPQDQLHRPLESAADTDGFAGRAGGRGAGAGEYPDRGRRGALRLEIDKSKRAIDIPPSPQKQRRGKDGAPAHLKG